MKHRIKYENGVYREREHCEACNGRGSVQPVYHGEREAPDAREVETCEACDGAGHTVLELHGADAEEAAHHEGIWTSQGAA